MYSRLFSVDQPEDLTVNLWESYFPHVHTQRPARSYTLSKRRLLPHLSHHSNPISLIYMVTTAFLVLLGHVCSKSQPAEQRLDNLWWFRAEERPQAWIWNTTELEGTSSTFPLLHEWVCNHHPHEQASTSLPLQNIFFLHCICKQTHLHSGTDCILTAFLGCFVSLKENAIPITQFWFAKFHIEMNA